jgi:hypothetical protein
VPALRISEEELRTLLVGQLEIIPEPEFDKALLGETTLEEVFRVAL